MQGKYSEKCELLIFILMSTFVVLFNNTTSPLFDGLSLDTTVFMYMGSIWADGGVPYVDFFDHKGPLLYLYYLIAQYIAPMRFGVSVVSIANLTIVMMLIAAIARTMVRNLSSGVLFKIVGTSVLLFVLAFETSALTEEFSLSYTLLALFLYTKFSTSGQNITQHPLLYSFIYGVCFGAIAMIRINNASVIVGIVCGSIVLLLKSKGYLATLKNGICFFCGVAVTISPFVLYFYANDALYEMFYANYIFNALYKASWVTPNAQTIWRNFTFLLPCILAIPLSLIYDKQLKTNYAYFVIPAATICFFAFLTGANYKHYFVNVIPFFALCMIFADELRSHVSNVLIIRVLLLVSIFPIAWSSRKVVFSQPKYVARYMLRKEPSARDMTQNENDTLVSLIPEKDRAFVYCYNAHDIFNSLARYKVKPLLRFAFFGDAFARVDAKIGDEIDEFNNNSDAKWIVGESLENIKRASLQRLLRKYELVYMTGDNLQLYRRIN